MPIEPPGGKQAAPKQEPQPAGQRPARLLALGAADKWSGCRGRIRGREADVEPWRGVGRADWPLAGRALPAALAMRRLIEASSRRHWSATIRLRRGSFLSSRGGARGGEPIFGVPGRQWFGGNAGAGRVLECVSAGPCLCSGGQRGRLAILGPFSLSF
jgi:hypothetical protein